ncbi:MAG: branched-chain amino acid ABC transporter substrate-binding protein [Candidatus Omnitrophica bacterium]|nr:branched-chain amino acid ABC transporter substrate-binding protein [Candidatus Omnitrophota bacterium]
MNPKPKKVPVTLVTVTFFTFFILAGCQEKEPVIKIGVSAPFTGDQASVGLTILNGAQLAVAQANEHGEVIPGYKLKLTPIDDQHNPTQAVTAAKKFVSDPAVLGVVGHLNSSCTKPASQVYFDGRLAQITPASTNPGISKQGFDTFFRICATDDLQGPKAAGFAFNELGARSVFIIDDKTTYGKGLADEFQKVFESMGGKVLGRQGITQGDKDFTPLLTRVRPLAPELIFYGGLFPEASLLIKQSRDLNISASFLGGDGIYDVTLIQLATPAASEGVYATMIGTDIQSLPQARRFVEAYEKKFGPVGSYSAYSFDAANILIEAIRSAGAFDRERVISRLKSGRTFSGILGPTEFDQDGDTKNKIISVFRVKNGKWEHVRTI